MCGILRSSSLGLLICVFSSSTLQAQATAQITGTVRDQAGMALPGTAITVTQTETGIARSTTSDKNGVFVFSNLPIGPYRLEAVLQGFRTQVRDGIILRVNSSSVINVEMEAGQAGPVQVQANAPLAQTRDSIVGQVFVNEQILGLPLNARNVMPLFTLGGAAVQAPTLDIASGLGFITAYNLDGANNRDPYTNQSLPVPFPDAVQELRVETSGLSAVHSEASSIAVVTKSGTNAFHGGVFEFVTNPEFNAKSYFAVRRDSLKRNQFGGTLGGPVKPNKLFFFVGYQGATLRQNPSTNFAFVPTPAILAGDWTTFLSPACSAGRQITLRPPFVNNQISPSSYSPAARAIASRLPQSQDPCGFIRYGVRSIADDHQGVARVDYQASDRHSLFGRYLGTHREFPSPFTPDNLLTSTFLGLDNFAQSYSFGDIWRFDPMTINMVHLTVNRNVADQKAAEFFSPADVGINSFSYVPKNVALSMTGAFSLGGGGSTLRTTSYQIADEAGVIRGRHDLSFGADLVQGRSNRNSFTNSTGSFLFTGVSTGVGMADFFVGAATQFSQSVPNAHYMRQSFVGLYGQDAWKAKPRLTVNYGLRWQPFLPQVSTNGKVYNFDLDRFRQGIRSTIFKNAPAGLYYPGDPGFPGKSGIQKRWLDFAPHVGLAWDVTGDGRTAVRTSYGLAYNDLPLQWRFNAGRVAPWTTQITLNSVALDDPWRAYPGGNPFPIKLDQNAAFPLFGSYETTPYKIHTTYVQSWNAGLQRQIGMDYLVSATYLGSRTIRMWVQKPLNPAVYMPGNQCTLNGMTYIPCSSVVNTNARRRLTLERQQDGQFFAAVDEFDDGGTQSYKGLLLSAQHRASRRMSVIGNYTLSYCTSDYADTNGVGPSAGASYLDPNNRRFDRGNCDSFRHHIFNLTAIAETPQFVNRAMRVAASGWRVSGIYTKSSGAFLTVTTGVDQALTGIANQRPNQVLENPYRDTSGRPLTTYLNPAAFAIPPPGTLGRMDRASIQGPGTWEFDGALSKTFRIRETQEAEFRAEAYNVTNSFRPDNPTTQFNNAVFGRINSSLPPRIMQFALKYMF